MRNSSWTRWLTSLKSQGLGFHGRKKSASRSSHRIKASRFATVPESLETRTLLTVDVLTLADPGLWGDSPQGTSSHPSMSSDGQLVVFSSTADDLVPNDTNGLPDAFLFDRVSGGISLISVGIDGKAAGITNGSAPTISPDGHYVSFESKSGNLPTGIANPLGISQVYLTDLSSHTTSLATLGVVGPSGVGDHLSFHPVFSADSHHLGFLSNANNLVPDITFTVAGGHTNVFERDLTTGVTQLVSVSQDGTHDQGGDKDVDTTYSMSADGRFVVFASNADNLAGQKYNIVHGREIFLRDLQTGVTTQVSINKDGTGGGDGISLLSQTGQSVSADGRFVTFHSTSTNLVPGKTTSGQNVFLRDLVNGVTSVLSTNSAGTALGGASGEIISPDGRFVAFMTSANLSPLDSAHNDVYVYDTVAQTLKLASINLAGTHAANADSGFLSSSGSQLGGLVFSPDSRSLFFRSAATDLLTGVSTSQGNLYRRDLVAGVTTLMTPNQAGTNGYNGEQGDIPAISSNGQFVAYSSTADNLILGDFNRQQDVFIRDVSANQTILASPRTPLFPAAFPATGGGTMGAANASLLHGGELGSVSADGRYVVFSSNVAYGKTYSDLAPSVTFSSTNTQSHVFLRDRQTGAIEVIDVAPNGTAVGGSNPVISPDGRFVAFLGSTSTLVPGITYTQGGLGGNIFIRDRQTHTTSIVSVEGTGTHDIPVGGGAELAISDDGRYVAFTTDATTPLSGVSNPTHNRMILMRDRVAGTTIVVSHDVANDGQIRGNSFNMTMTSDGRYVLFVSTDANLATGDANNGEDVFRWDRTTGLVKLVSMNYAGTGSADKPSSQNERPVMTADGRHIYFSSSATNIEAPHPLDKGYIDLFVRDMGDGVSLPVTSIVIQGSDGDTYAPSISSDGSVVGFLSTATLVAPPPPHTRLAAGKNVFLIGPTGLKLVSLNINGNDSGNDTSFGPGTEALGNNAPVVSADGRFLLFASRATDLLPNFVDGNTSQQSDLYLYDVQQNTKRLVTYNESGTASANAEQSRDQVLFSHDGNTLVFDSTAGNLFIGDRNGPKDVFAYDTRGNATISGQVFSDQNNNGSNNSETGLQYWTVFIDSNHNQLFDQGEPNVITDSTGHYVLNGIRPGTYPLGAVAQPGYQRTLPTPANGGLYSVTVASGGASISKDFGEYIPLADLKTSNVTFTPNSAAPGQSVNVSWTVKNQGNGPATGNWQDEIYLSPTPTLDKNAVILKTVTHAGPLAAGTQYTANTSVQMPTLEGTWYVIVRSDRRGQVNEGTFGANKANNTAPSAATLTIAIPQLTLAASVGDTLSAASPDRYYKLNVPTGHSLVLTLGSTAASGQLELYVRRGDLPTPYDFDLSSRVAAQPGQRITVPNVEPGVYYVLVHGVSGAALTSSFTLSAAEPGLKLQSLGLTTGGNAGLVTIPIHGTDLTASTPVSLVLGNVSISPKSVSFQDASLMYVTFDLTGRAAGIYTLKIGNGSQSATFTVTAAHGPNLQVHLSTPDSVRTNHPGADLVVDFENTGDTDMPAPVFLMNSVGHPDNIKGFLQLMLGGIPVSSDRATSVQFVGQGGDSPGGILRAGDKGQVKVHLTLDFVDAGGGPYIEITLHTMATDTTPIDWATFKTQFQPSTIPSDAWDVIYSNFTTAVGSTVGQFQSTTVADTAYLNQIGADTTDITNLLAFEMLRADASLPVATLAGDVDASVPTPGLSLDFGRAFLQSISGRYRQGILGRGWVSNWETAAVTEANGDVLIQDAGAFRSFTKQADGTFAGIPGDYAQLTVVSGVYQLKEANGLITRFRANGSLDFEQDTNGNRITASYNAGGQLTSLTHSNGKSLTIAYTAQGRVSTVTDPSGRVATYHYDAAGQHLTSVTTVDGTTQYGYVTGQTPAQEHALTSITYPDGTQTHFTYDTQGRLTGNFQGSAANPIHPVTLSYNSLGGVTFTDAAGSTTILYNQFGQPAVMIDPLGHVTKAGYDSLGNLTNILLPGGLTYAYAYDSRGNLSSSTDPLGRTSSFQYDSLLNRLTSSTDPLGRSTSYGHDADGNLLSITYPDGSHQNFSYDPLGNLAESINVRGHAIDYTYNTNGQVTRETFADASHLDFTYDTHGNLATAVDASGTTTFVYDTADRLTKVTYPDAKFLQFTYNAGGQRTKSVDQTGYTLNYQYDAAGRLAALKDGSNTSVVSYVYDTAGRLSEKDLGNGTYTTYQYDAAGELLHLVNHAPRPTPNQAGPVNSFFDYTYDNLGRVATQTNSDGAWVYTYDAVGELTQAVFTSANLAQLPNQNLQYFYDAAGNRTKTILNGVTTNYTVNNLNEVTQMGASAYTYDADGNLLTSTTAGVTTNYTFDDLNRLTGVSSPTDTFSYAFDSLGQLASSTHNSQTTRYLNDPTGFGNLTGLGTRVGEFNGGTTLAHYAWGLGLVSRSDSGGSAYYDFDALGSTVGITKGAGTYVNRYSYLPFGETRTLTPVVPNAAVANPFTFVGQFGVTNDGNGLLGMGFRSYSPTTGQFISNDPLGLGGGDTNIRRYVRNAVTFAIDPTGLQEVDDEWLDREIEESNRLADREIDNLQDDRNPFHQELELAHRSSAARFRADWHTDRVDPNNPYSQEYEFAKYNLKKLREFKQAFDDWFPFAKKIQDFLHIIHLTGPSDPNELLGPGGFGAPQWISSDPASLPYTVEFQNDPKKATVAAQDVTITQQLDPDLDWSTFQLGTIQFGSHTVPVPSGLQTFSTTVAATNVDGTPLRVDISAALNQQTGLVTWTFHSLDPATGLFPDNPEAGFLPVDDETHRGQGLVNFFVKQKSGLPTGTLLTEQASIVFDTNAALATNTTTNTIDAGNPTSHVNSLGNRMLATTFPVSWTGSDDAGGSGVATYDVYVSDNGGQFTLWQTATAITSANYTGVDGHTYAFFSVATDNVGHTQPKPTAAQASTLVHLVHAPQLGGAGTVAYVKKQPQIVVLPNVAVTDSDENLGGGSLTVRITDVTIGKKLLRPDTLNTDSLGALGTVAMPQIVNGQLLVTVQLKANLTAAQVQSALRGIKFATTTKGLKTTSRTLGVQIVDSDGATSNLLTQTIQVLKKAPANASPAATPSTSALGLPQATRNRSLSTTGHHHSGSSSSMAAHVPTAVLDELYSSLVPTDSFVL